MQMQITLSRYKKNNRDVGLNESWSVMKVVTGRKRSWKSCLRGCRERLDGCRKGLAVLSLGERRGGTLAAVVIATDARGAEAAVHGRNFAAFDVCSACDQ